MIVRGSHGDDGALMPHDVDLHSDIGSWDVDPLRGARYELARRLDDPVGIYRHYLDAAAAGSGSGN
ncbi:hypothetical protein [Amycolatopsis sp. NPDC059021]|uniref:hypothetical protein n=1 Tax=Amycolatopsis sp. NPDC059021 TaxID=3346704 RepID=UPI00366CBC56